MKAQISALETSMAAVQKSISEDVLAKGDADAFYLVVMGSLVFFMQAGFALLEAGSVRSKNTKNILMKNVLDACIASILWWAWGFAIAVSQSQPTKPKCTSNGGHTLENSVHRITMSCETSGAR